MFFHLSSCILLGTFYLWFCSYVALYKLSQDENSVAAKEWSGHRNTHLFYAQYQHKGGPLTATVGFEPPTD